MAAMPTALRRLCLLEPVSVNSEHAPFDAAFLEAFGLAFPQASLRYWGAAAHVEALRAWVDASVLEGVSWHQAVLPSRQGRFWQRVWAERRLLRAALEDLGNEPGSVLLLLATLPSTLFALRWAGLRRFSHVRVLAVVHGNLSEVAGWRSRDPRFRAVDLRSAMAWGLKAGVEFVVLEQGIAQAAVELWPDLAAGLSVVEHPFPGQPRVGDCDRLAGRQGVDIGFLGMPLAVKGFARFARWAAHFARGTAEACGEGLRFNVVGPMSDQAGAVDWSVFATLPSEGWMAAQAYQAGIEAQDFVCLPYEPSHYRFAASGVLLDAVRFGKPVLAFRTPTLTELERRFGEIGFVVEDEAQMLRLLEQLARGVDRARYRQQCENMQAVARSRTAAGQVEPVRAVVSKALAKW